VKVDGEGVGNLDAVGTDEALTLHRAGCRLGKLDRLEPLTKQGSRPAFDCPFEPAFDLTE
jgi:hypothetical protein